MKRSQRPIMEPSSCTGCLSPPSASPLSPACGSRREAPDRLWINLFDAFCRARASGPRICRRRWCWWRCRSPMRSICCAPGWRAASGSTRSACAGLLRRGQARLRAVNTVLYWFFFVTMTALLVSGGLLYFGLFAGYDVAMLHWYATWALLAFRGLHVLTHVRLGGMAQLLRIFRPTQPRRRHRRSMPSSC